MGYRDEIEAALEREKMPEEAERGIMRWYSDPDGVNRKVLSEVRDDRLWCVTDCKVLGRLTPKELDALKGFISGQASDGYAKFSVMRSKSVKNAVIQTFFTLVTRYSA